MRTYVSGTGNDSYPCLASWPCQTFQAALALTVAGGEIYVLDSANYGAVTINKAVSITSEGAMAGVLATSGAGKYDRRRRGRRHQPAGSRYRRRQFGRHRNPV